MGGKLLFGDVSFKLEPRERMTLSGRNGAGKSTLLRMLARRARAGLGQPRAAERGPRRPPRPAPAARIGGLARRVRLLRPRRHDRDRGGAGPAGGGDVVRQPRRGDDGCLRRGPAALRPRRRLSLARRRPRRAARARLRRGRDPAPSLDLLRRRADPRLPRPGARHPPRPAAARRAHQPPRHPLARVAGALPGRPRRRGRPRRPRPLVPRGGRHLGARARGESRPLLRRALARLAQGAGGARDRPRQGDRPPAGGDRADGAIRRALPLQGDQGQAGAVADQADRQDQARRGQRRTEGQAQPALLLRGAGAARPHRRQTRRRRRSRFPGGRCWRTPSSNSKGGSTSSSSAPTAPARRR